MKRKKLFLFGVFLLSSLLVYGCASLQPRTSHRQTDSIAELPFKTYEEAKNAAEKILPGITTFGEMKKIGFNPSVIPNTTKLLQVRKEILPSSADPSMFARLSPGEQACYLIDSQCEGYRFSFGPLDVKGRGSYWKRIAKISREDITEGWRFELEVFLIPRKYLEPKTEGSQKGEEKLVVLERIGGDAKIKTISIKKSPLGFIEPFVGINNAIPINPVRLPRIDMD